MLCLSRKKEEEIYIEHEASGTRIRILVLGFSEKYSGGLHEVKLGIQAPPEYQIHRCDAKRSPWRKS